MITVNLQINGKAQTVTADPSTPLLWILRDHLEVTGTKYGCGLAQCGACTVHLNGQALRSCSLPLSALPANAEVVTIEGLSTTGDHILQTLWAELNVPQCGYCQSGILMAAADLLAKNPAPSDTDIDAAITNICRCGTYPRVRAAIHRAAEQITNGKAG
jgi:isoquinoline 1-oxidoreductase subunit alpha